MAMMDARLAQWFASGDTGISSKTIALWMAAGVPYDPAWGDGTPSDGADFGRCYRLLQAIPEWRPRIAEMADRGGKWPHLVKHWDEIETLYLREIAEPDQHGGITYERMKVVEADAYEAMGYTVVRRPDGSMQSATAPNRPA